MSWCRPPRAFVLALSLVGAMNVAAGAAEVSYVLAIANGRVPESMRLIRVKQNDLVKLKWSTDKPVSVHLHGYDIKFEVPSVSQPFQGKSLSFTVRMKIGELRPAIES